MGIITSLAKESVQRQYRVLTKDELTFLIYRICKNTMAKWCFPLRNPEEVSQEEINKFLDDVDFRTKKIRMNFLSLQRSFDVPYDFYLRGIYRYAERLETNIGTNMDKVLFETVLGEIYGDDSKCISKLHMTVNQENYFSYTFNDTITSTFMDENTTDMMKAILSIYSKCKYGSIIVSSFEKKPKDQKEKQQGHRTIIYIENYNNILNVYYYDPHGSSKYSWSNEMKVYESIKNIFIGMKSVMSNFGITDIIFNKYESICLFGIQAMSFKYDIGMCQIYSSLWLYIVTKIIAESTKNRIQLPNTIDWLYLVDDYFIGQFNMKQRYNAILLFITKLFDFYATHNKNYAQELENYNAYLLANNPDELPKFEIPYETKPQDFVNEMEKYLVATARKGIIEKRKEEKEIARGIKPVITKKRVAEIPVDESYKQYKKRVKTQLKEEEEYDKSLRSYLPFSKKKLFEECSANSQCISGCCYKDDAQGISVCNESEACQN